MGIVRPSRILHDALVLLGTGILGTAAALTLTAALYHGKSFDTYAVVADPQGPLIGRCGILPGLTSVSVGTLQVPRPQEETAGTMTAPAWAQLTPPPPWTAVGSVGEGWPWRFLISRHYVNHNASPPMWRAIRSYEVYAPGLLGNVLLFGIAWLAGRETVRALIRFWRLWRGHCPRCNYNLCGQLTPGCPECGWRRPLGVSTASPA